MSLTFFLPTCYGQHGTRLVASCRSPSLPDSLLTNLQIEERKKWTIGLSCSGDYLCLWEAPAFDTGDHIVGIVRASPSSVTWELADDTNVTLQTKDFTARPAGEETKEFLRLPSSTDERGKPSWKKLVRKFLYPSLPFISIACLLWPSSRAPAQLPHILPHFSFICKLFIKFSYIFPTLTIILSRKR